jgi:hypothetical protein
MEEVLKLIERAINISTTCQADIFVDYSPHVERIHFMAHKDGWFSNSRYLSYYIYFDKSDDDISERVEEINEAFDELEKQK